MTQLKAPKTCIRVLEPLLVLYIFDGHCSNLDSRGLTSIGFKESSERKNMKGRQAFKSDKIKYV